jgi:hypothetical protein
MTERQSRTGIRRYRSRVEAEQLAAEFQASGLTRREFCEGQRVALNTLNRYLSRYSRRETDDAPELVQVEVAEPGGFRAEVTVVLGRGRRVEVARGFDSVTLQQVVSVLERC